MEMVLVVLLASNVFWGVVILLNHERQFWKGYKRCMKDKLLE